MIISICYIPIFCLFFKILFTVDLDILTPIASAVIVSE